MPKKRKPATDSSAATGQIDEDVATAPAWLTGSGSEWRLRVRVQPGAAHDEIAQADTELLRIRLTAPPVDGRANDALVRFLAGILSVPRRDIRLVTGRASRTKTVLIRGVGRAGLIAAVTRTGDTMR